MNQNYSRYFDSIGVAGLNKNTFLNKWHKNQFGMFYKKYAEEFQQYNQIWCDAYDTNSYDEFTKKETALKIYNPQYTHRLEYLLASLPKAIEHWLCCGFEWRYDKQLKHWTWFQKYHMMTKLCRYETWKNVKITWWDKLRFKWITGYDFE